MMLGKQMKENLRKEVNLHPSGDYKNVISGTLERIRKRYYVGAMEIPFSEIDSALRIEGRLDLEINPEYFSSNKHLARPS